MNSAVRCLVNIDSMDKPNAKFRTPSLCGQTSKSIFQIYTKMNAKTAEQAFADGDIASGEILLARSGEKGDQSDFAIPVLFAALVEVLTTATEPKCSELAAGIVANLLLHNGVNDLCIEALGVPMFLYECCTVVDDPYTIAEILRGLANLIYVGKSECLHASLPTLSSLVLYLAENSLSPKLLIHVVQLVYYIQVYCSNTRMLLDWESSWDAKSFYLHLLGNDAIVNPGDVDGVVSSLNNEELYSTVLKLQSESVGDCTGLEWLLLSIDRVALSQSIHSPVVCNSEEILKFIVHLLLSQCTQGWDRVRSKPPAKSLGVRFNLYSAEKFLAVSVLDSIVSYRTSQALDSSSTENSNLSVLLELFTIANQYSTKECDGWMALTQALLETLEDAVLMKDRYGLYASANLLNQMFKSNVGLGDTTLNPRAATTSPEITFLTERFDVLYPLIQNILEVLATIENIKWLESYPDNDAEKVNLAGLLLTVKKALLQETSTQKLKELADAKRVGSYSLLVSAVEKIVTSL